MENSNFKLHATLAADTCTIAELPLCRLLLSNDANYPWSILVPRRDNITEIHQLNPADQLQLITESSALSQCLQSVLSPDKLNIAALGNMVPQLHIHHIARYKNDKAWPSPVWGHSPATTYDSYTRDQLVARINSWLDNKTDLTYSSRPAAKDHGDASSDKPHPRYQLAQLNIANQQHPLEAPEMADFVTNLERINRLADDAPGFVWRLQTEDGDATGIRYFGENVVVNMSTWEDISSLHDYVYQSAHIEVLKRRREWFTSINTYSVLWWVESGTKPTIEEAAHRLELLKKHGPHKQAFTFKRSWPEPTT